MRAATLLVLALVLPIATLQGQQSWPAQQWPTTTPRVAGLDGAILEALGAEIRSGRYGYIDRFVIIRGGRIAFDESYKRDYDRAYGELARRPTSVNSHHMNSPYNYYSSWWHPFYRRGKLHTLQSVTKTITSVVIGTAVTRGEFPSLDTPVHTFFDAAKVANLDDRKRRITIRHLLTMTAGLDWEENAPYGSGKSCEDMEASYDWVKFAFDRPMVEEPGTRFNYNSGATQILAHIFFRATGVDIEEYAAKHLFGPIGIHDWYWKRTPNGLVDTEGGLYLSAEDLARVMYLFLRNGSWNGKQIVRKEWVRDSVTPWVPTDRGSRAGFQGTVSYGYQWWLDPNPLDSKRTVWGGSGFGGQMPFILPEYDLIIVINAWNIISDKPRMPRAAILERILGAVKDARK